MAIGMELPLRRPLWDELSRPMRWREPHTVLVVQNELAQA
jgi:hypothetical protein